MSGEAKDSAPRNPPDFWEVAKQSEKMLQVYVPRLLDSLAISFKSTKFADVTSAMYHIVSVTTVFRENIQRTLDARHITFDTFTEELEGIFLGILNDLENIPPHDHPPGRAERLEMVDKILDDTALGLKKLATRCGIEKEVVSAYLSALKPHLQSLIVAVGDIIEQHPQLFSALSFGVVGLLIPELWILQPLLRLFGFGITGPVKDSGSVLPSIRLWGTVVEPLRLLSLLRDARLSVSLKRSWLAISPPPWVGRLLAHTGLLLHGRKERPRRSSKL